MRIRRFSSALVFVVLVAGVAHGEGVRFKGSTVTFRVEGATIKAFTLTASALCLVAGRGSNEIRVIPLEEPAKLDGDGRFALTLDQQGTKASVTGRVAGDSADGRFEVRYTKTVSSYDPITRNPKFEIASCSAKAPWTAARQA